jgi:competence protein ComEC
VPVVAAIPALSLIAGCAAGLFLNDPSSPFLESLLGLATLAGIVAWFASRPRVLLAAIVLAFFAGGALLAGRAWQDAWQPPLRQAFDAAVRDERADAQATNRFITEDIVVPMDIDGVLRADASPTDTGASLGVDVQRIDVGAEGARDAAGGVLLNVAGDAARNRAGEWRAGRRIHATVQLRRPARYLDPGVPDEERLLARRGTTLVGTIKSAALIDIVARGSPPAEAAAAVRAFVRRAVSTAVGRWDAQSAAIVTAIVIGDRVGLDDHVQRSLQEAGTYHVIAISGGNIAILAGLTLLAFRIAGVLGRTAMLSAIVGLIAYGYLVGGGASVDRATLMAVIYFAGRAVDQRSPPFNTLAVAAGLLAAFDPLFVADPAFLLTFGATAAILAAMPLVATLRVSKWALPAVGMVAASAASEAALLPVSAAVFSRVTFAGLALNFAAIPCMAVAQVAGMALVPIALVSTRLAGLFGFVAFISARALVLSAELVRFAPAVTWRVAAPGAFVIVCYYGGLAGAWTWLRSRRFRHARTAAIAAWACAALWLLCEPWSYVAAKGDGHLHVTFIDVGQGDSAFITFPGGASMLIDTGGLPGNSSFDVGDRVVAPVLRRAGLRHLQTIALTHGDNDHIGGAASVMREFGPADLWEGVPVPSFPALKALRRVADETRTRWTNVQALDCTSIDGVQLVVRNPPLPDWERQHVRNDDSIVIEMLWKNVSLVFTGDAGAATEHEIAGQFRPSPLRVVKVPHHGSPTSSTEEFLEALAPRVAVVSVGRSNNFGHPAPAILRRYRDAGAEIFRTDQDGAVMLETDGETVRVKTFTGREKTFASNGVPRKREIHETPMSNQ